jgi:hypothetical protein
MGAFWGCNPRVRPGVGGFGGSCSCLRKTSGRGHELGVREHLLVIGIRLLAFSGEVGIVYRSANSIIDQSILIQSSDGLTFLKKPLPVGSPTERSFPPASIR